MLVYPPEGHETDSKEVFILGSARLSCLINHSAIKLEKNGNFCKLIRLKLGENKIQINIDGKSFTLTVYGVLNINNNPNPIAYAQPYRAFTKQANSNNGRVAERTSSRLRRTNDRNVSSIHEDHEDDENAEIGVPLQCHDREKAVHLIGLNLSLEERNITEYLVERV